MSNKTIIISNVFRAVFVYTAIFGFLSQSTARAVGLDTDFGSNGRVIYSPTSTYDVVRRVRIQPDGKIVSFGGNPIGSSGPSFIVRHASDGSLDTGFGTAGIVFTPAGGGAYFYDMAIQGNTNIVLAGSIPNHFTDHATGFMIYNRLGTRVFPSADVSYDDSPARRLLVRNNGNLLVISGFGRPTSAGANLSAIAYNGNTFDFDYSLAGDRPLALSNVYVDGGYEFWSSYGDDSIGDAALQPDGKILMSGHNRFEGGKLVRLNSDGTLDSSFGTNGVATFSPISSHFNHPSGLAVQPDGKILICGISAEFGLYTSFVVRLNPNGSVDQTFGTNGYLLIPEPDSLARGIAVAMALQPNGKIILGGERSGGFALMRFNANGTLDTGFGTNGTLTTHMGLSSRAAILSLAWQSDGKLLAGGSVGDPANQTDIGLARFRVDDSGLKVSGRILTPGGQPLRNATVSLIDASIRRTATTSSFGVFEFSNLEPARPYNLTVASKRYRFSATSIQLTADATLGDIVGLE